MVEQRAERERASAPLSELRRGSPKPWRRRVVGAGGGAPAQNKKCQEPSSSRPSEFLTLIRTKAFLIGVFLMPAFMGGAIVMQKTMMERPDTERREFAVVDHTGVLYEPLARAAEVRNRAVAPEGGTVRAGAFVPSQVDTSGRRIEDIRLELSDRIRREGAVCLRRDSVRGARDGIHAPGCATTPTTRRTTTCHAGWRPRSAARSSSAGSRRRRSTGRWSIP